MNAQVNASAHRTGQTKGRTSADGQRSARPDAVPFITRWSGEPLGTSPIVARRDGRGIRYADERFFDRVDGVLWARLLPSRVGAGRSSEPCTACVSASP